MDDYTLTAESLTSRELQIVGLIGDGLSYAEIGKQIYIEKTTVKWYVQEMYDKLGLHKPHRNQKQLIAKARKSGLLAEAPVDIPRNNLPAQTTRFIGREQELEDLAELLDDPQIRLITILAPGGMGKSRLALEMSENVLRGVGKWCTMPLQNGVFFVSLAPINSPENIPNAIATATGFQFMSDRREPKQQILDYLSNKKMLLIIDNYEHVLDGAGVVTEILQAAPDVQIVTTSRERLNLRGETVYTLSGMTCTDDALYDCEAVNLFANNARLVQPDFRVDAGNVEIITSICSLVEGMPLAIVLATAWVEVLSLLELAYEITQSVDFLAAEMRDVPRRQWSIRAVFEPTWERLTKKQQAAFLRMSVFRGGATRKAAQTVAGVGLPTLQALVNKSLITRSTERNPQGRYNIHEMLRQFAETKLDESGEMDAVRDAHSEYYLTALAEREADIKGRDQLGALNDIESDFENVKAAWYWAVEQKHYDVVASALECLNLFCKFRSRIQDGIAIFGQARETFAPQPGEEPRPVWGKVLLRYHEDGNIPGRDNRPHIEQCLEIAEKHGDQREIAFCLSNLGQATATMGDIDGAMTLLEESLRHIRGLDDKSQGAGILNNLGVLGTRAGYSPDRCADFYHRSIEMARESGNKVTLTLGLNNLGWLMATRRNHGEAETYLQEAYAIAQGMRSPSMIAAVADNLSKLAFYRGDFDRARAFLDEVSIISNFLSEHYRYYNQAMGSPGLEIVAENYTEARQLCQLYRSFWVLESTPQAVVLIDRWLSLAACGLQDYPAARLSLQSALSVAIRLKMIYRIIGVLPAAAIIEAHEGDQAHAVGLLGLAFSYPQGLVGWMEKWPLLTRLRADLKADLGEEAYNAAWERGKQLDLETVVKELLEEFAED
jgi:predicted ATPase/DNA-binding CsgD family transcriptional regulator